MKSAREKKVLTVLIVGSVILAWRVYAIISTFGPASAQAESNTAAQPAPDLGTMKSLWVELSHEVVSAQSALDNQTWGRDPFLIKVRPVEVSKPEDVRIAPAVTQPDPPQIKRFNGVSRSGDRWLVAIDGRIYRVGDVFDVAYTITEITSNSVTLTAAGWAFEFSLGSQKPNIRQPTERP